MSTAEQYIEPAEADFGYDLGALSSADRDALIDEALERIAEFEAEKARVAEYAARRVAMVQAHRDEEIAKKDAAAAFWIQRVEHLAAGYDYGKKKSRRLAFGEFGMRKRPDRVEIVDEAKLLDFARGSNLPIVVKESVPKKELSALCKSGFMPDPEEDGFSFVPGEDEFYFKAGS